MADDFDLLDESGGGSSFISDLFGDNSKVRLPRIMENANKFRNQQDPALSAIFSVRVRGKNRRSPFGRTIPPQRHHKDHQKGLLRLHHPSISGDPPLHCWTLYFRHRNLQVSLTTQSHQLDELAQEVQLLIYQMHLSEIQAMKSHLLPLVQLLISPRRTWLS